MSFIQSVVCHFVLVAIVQLIAATPTWHTASDGNSYLIEGDQKYNWLQAQDECARRNLQMVIIDSAAKNAPFDALIRKVFAKSPNLWLGHHDEFNKLMSTSRPFFTSSTGNQLSYGNWNHNEPNNIGSGEHCAHIFTDTDYKWNDINCQNYHFGYICEQHHLTNKFNKDLEQKRLITHQKNDKVAADYKITRDDTQNALSKGNSNTNNILIGFDNTMDEILRKSKDSMRDIVRIKPYLEAAIADVGDIINEILKDTQQEALAASRDVRAAVQDVQNETENSVNEISERFANTLANNLNDIDMILE